jgi:hypothetical protein
MSIAMAQFVLIFEAVDDGGIGANQKRASHDENQFADIGLIKTRAQQQRAKLIDDRPTVEKILIHWRLPMTNA